MIDISVKQLNEELPFLGGTEIIEEHPEVLIHPKKYIEGLSSYIISEDTNEHIIDIYYDIISSLALYICANKPKPAFLYRYILLLSNILQLYIYSDHMLKSTTEIQEEAYKYIMGNYKLDNDNPGGFYYPDIDKKKFEELINSDFDERFDIRTLIDLNLTRKMLDNIK